MTARYYAGIGSRQTPAITLEYFRVMAAHLEQHGYVLRSGGADGADTAFERGVTHAAHKQIFLPWRRFNGRDSQWDAAPPPPKRFTSLRGSTLRGIGYPIRRGN